MKNSNKTNIVLWTVQGLLALFFALASGAPKLLLPMEMIPMPLPLPEAFIRFIGTAEVLGALGLILPGLTHIRTWLTPLAALGLVVVATSGAVYQLAAQQPANAVFALIIALLAGIVGYARWRVKPLSTTHLAALEAAV